MELRNNHWVDMAQYDTTSLPYPSNEADGVQPHKSWWDFYLEGEPKSPKHKAGKKDST